MMIHCKAAQRLCFLKRAGVECIHIVRICVARVFSLLDYACQVRHIGLTVLDSDKLEGIQKSDDDSIPRAILRMRHKPCQHKYHTHPTWRAVSTFLQGYMYIVSLTHRLHHLLLSHVSLFLLFIACQKNILSNKCYSPVAHYSMARVRTMRTSVCKIYSYERTRLCQQLYLIDLTYQNKSTNVDAMYAICWCSFHTNNIFPSIENTVYIHAVV